MDPDDHAPGAAPDRSSPDPPETGLDGDVPAGDPSGEDEPGRFDRWRRESALGAVGTGVARGLHAVFAPPREEPAIVASAPGDPPGTDGQLRVILDPDDPTKALAIVPEETDPPAP